MVIILRCVLVYPSGRIRNQSKPSLILPMVDHIDEGKEVGILVVIADAEPPGHDILVGPVNDGGVSQAEDA